MVGWGGGGAAGKRWYGWWEDPEFRIFNSNALVIPRILTQLTNKLELDPTQDQSQH